jgi:hypothetical protein
MKMKESSLEYGEIDAALNFQPLTEAQIVQQRKLALETYRRQGSRVPHDRIKNIVKRHQK